MLPVCRGTAGCLVADAAVTPDGAAAAVSVSSLTSSISALPFKCDTVVGTAVFSSSFTGSFRFRSDDAAAEYVGGV